MKYLVILGLLAGMMGSGQAFAYWETHDEYTMELKGFSPELIQMTELQVNRMEGRYPEPGPGKPKQMFFNLINNNWGESTKPFGQDTISPPFLPRPKHL